LTSPFLIQIELTIVDIHCYFKTETQVCVAWCFPFHRKPPEVFKLLCQLDQVSCFEVYDELFFYATFDIAVSRQPLFSIRLLDGLATRPG